MDFNNISSDLFNMNQQDALFLLIYFNSKPLHVSSRLAAHHQEDRLCINRNWFSHALCWLAAGRIPIYHDAWSTKH